MPCPCHLQINVVVGAFFVISGYVAAYTTTELGQPGGLTVRRQWEIGRRGRGGTCFDVAEVICPSVVQAKSFLCFCCTTLEGFLLVPAVRAFLLLVGLLSFGNESRSTITYMVSRWK